MKSFNRVKYDMLNHSSHQVSVRVGHLDMFTPQYKDLSNSLNKVRDQATEQVWSQVQETINERI
jgi:hypothetical protein